MIQTTLLKQTTLAAALLAAGQCASADVSVTQDETSFRAATTATGTDDFFGVPTTSAGASPMNRITLNGETYRYTVTASTGGLLGTAFPSDTAVGADTATDTITFDHFSTGITAFGGYFFSTDFNGSFMAGNVTLTATDASGATFTQTVSPADAWGFVGFQSSGPAITSVSLSSAQLPSGDSAWPNARMVVMGQAVSAVPEPSPLALMAVGLCGITVLRRRQLRSNDER